jgi:4,5-dihydroxyphthalate decarboxylase
MSFTIRLALRDWDYLTPIQLGDVRASDFNVAIDRVCTLPVNLAGDPNYDGAEMSFSRYAQSRARGGTGIVAVPHFLMRAFRHRCIITAKSNPITTLEGLAGRSIGMAGWPDSGNTWTRALLRRAGVGIDDVRWYLGRLNRSDPVLDRLEGFGRPGRIEAVPGERPLMELLANGEIDAVFTPFMPPGFFEADSPFRPLVQCFRSAELAYFHDVGYVPGIHLLALKPAVVAEHPTLPQALSELLDESARLWADKRETYADTTPWIIDEIRRCAHDLPRSWDCNGFAANERMIADFAAELHAQNLTARRLAPSELFPQAVA